MKVRVFGDFNGVDGNGLIQLTSDGSRRDLSRNPDVKEGDRIVIYDDDRQAEAGLERRGVVWFARIDWKTLAEAGTDGDRLESDTSSG